MVQSRTAFLEKDYYDFMRQALKDETAAIKPNVLADLGCGQGWYTKEFAPLAGQCYGIDLSKEAIAHAAGQDKKTQYIVGSIYDLPFEDESVDLLISIFTPIPEEEARRVLKADGVFLVVSPGTNHHHELKEILYETVRPNDPPKDLEGFVLKKRQELSEKKHVDDAMELLDMTPYRYKSPQAGVERVRNLNGLDVTFDFLLSTWRKAK